MTAALAFAAASLAVAQGWQSGPALPVPRTEVAAAVAGSEIVVAGGDLADGKASARVDLYDPKRRAWRRGPSLPQPLNHAAMTALGKSAVLVGGYAGRGNPTRTAARFDGTAWRELRPLPWPRAAAAAAAPRGRGFVRGGGRPGRGVPNLRSPRPPARRRRPL